MYWNRRNFVKGMSLAGFSLMFKPRRSLAQIAAVKSDNQQIKPIVLSTWRFGLVANAEAWKTLSTGGSALDAVEQGVRVIEADPKERSVGYGGRPDRDGIVTLDACIMDEHGNIGSVAALQNIMHPISVARKVMEHTPHAMLVGAGALAFAISEGFPQQNLLTETSKKEWETWLKKSKYAPKANIENHDTIGMIAIDEKGNLSGSCTTSGMAFKMHGRVGDSPIIGAGLFVDNEVGAAVATGDGEEVMRIAGTHLIVELMRLGKTPQEACEEAVARIIDKCNKRGKDLSQVQVGFIALNKNGKHGAFSVQSGFNYAIYTHNLGNMLINAEHSL